MTGPGFPLKPGCSILQPWQGSVQAAVEAAAGQPHTWCLRGSRMRTREGLMEEWARAASFPRHFGGNWDALRDALSDLPEGGTFVVLEADQLLQDAAPEDAAILWRVLEDVREDQHPKPFRLVLQAEPTHYNALVVGLRRVELDSDPRDFTRKEKPRDPQL